VPRRVDLPAPRRIIATMVPIAIAGRSAPFWWAEWPCGDEMAVGGESAGCISYCTCYRRRACTWVGGIAQTPPTLQETDAPDPPPKMPGTRRHPAPAGEGGGDDKG
jgi:hypothetical protein